MLFVNYVYLLGCLKWNSYHLTEYTYALSFEGNRQSITRVSPWSITLGTTNVTSDDLNPLIPEKTQIMKTIN